MLESTDGPRLPWEGAGCGHSHFPDPRRISTSVAQSYDLGQLDCAPVSPSWQKCNLRNVSLWTLSRWALAP